VVERVAADEAEPRILEVELIEETGVGRPGTRALPSHWQATIKKIAIKAA
jgi:hypothetical protein